jgi:hypothetical protein
MFWYEVPVGEDRLLMHDHLKGYLSVEELELVLGDIMYLKSHKVILIILVSDGHLIQKQKRHILLLKISV